MYHLAILDDNQAWCFALTLQLQRQGYIVSTFTSVQAFLREAEQFDLALIDFSMPVPRYQHGMDGPEVIYKVKQQLKDPPLLVLISSFFTDDLLNGAAEICPEADAIWSKQIETTEMFAQIQRLLEGKKPVEPSRHRANSANLMSSSSE